MNCRFIKILFRLHSTHSNKIEIIFPRFAYFNRLIISKSIMCIICLNPLFSFFYLICGGIIWIIYSAITIHDCDELKKNCAQNINILSIVGITVSLTVISLSILFSIVFIIKRQNKSILDPAEDLLMNTTNTIK